VTAEFESWRLEAVAGLVACARQAAVWRPPIPVQA